MNGKLSGKTVLVTGASKGIGQGLAKGLAAAGARVAVNYRRMPRERTLLAGPFASPMERVMFFRPTWDRSPSSKAWCIRSVIVSDGWKF